MSMIHIAGLGPGDPEHLTRQTERLLHSGLRVLLRTRHHPTIAALPAAARWEALDGVYQSNASFGDVYAALAARVIEAAASGDVVYAVPGSPLVAERSVTLLLEQAAAMGHETTVYPALSFADAAAVTLRIDLGRVQLCDALDLRIDAQQPALVHQIFDRDAATNLKLRLLEIYPAGHLVTFVHAAGAPASATRELALSEIDHGPWSYLDALYVPPLRPLEDLRRFDGLEAVVRHLHGEGGCPWDREQTHETLRHHLLEESYETLEAIDRGEPGALAEELGDLLLQVLMHAAVAERTNEFTLADVVEQIARKLVRRHPHVFGEATAETAADVYRNWEALKQLEKPRASVLDGVPATLPALAQAQSMQGRARRIGFDWPDMDGPIEKLAEEIGEFARASGAADREAEFGDILFTAAGIAQRLEIDAEQALRGAARRFRARFGELERAAAADGADLRGLSTATLLERWQLAKAAVAAEPVVTPAPRPVGYEHELGPEDME